MQGMIQDKLICHASGDFSKPFILGFYLYHIVQDKENQRGRQKLFIDYQFVIYFLHNFLYF